MKKIILLAIIAFTSFSLFAQTVGQYGTDSIGNYHQFGADGKWHPAWFIARNSNGDSIGVYRTPQARDAASAAANARLAQQLQTQGVTNSPTITVTNSYRSNNQSSSSTEGYYDGTNGYVQSGYGNTQMLMCVHCHHRHYEQQMCSSYLFNGLEYMIGARIRCTYYRNYGYVPNMIDGTWCTLRRTPQGFLGWFPTYTQQSGCNNGNYNGWDNQYNDGMFHTPIYNRFDNGNTPPAGADYGVQIH